MIFVQIIFMILAAVAGVLWGLALYGCAAAFFPGEPVEALARTVQGPLLLMSPWLVLWALSVVVGIWLAPEAWGHKHFTVAMRGAPRLLRLAMWTSWALALVASPLLAAFLGTWPKMQSAPLDMVFFSYACCVFVSAGRLGLGKPRCTNGHELAEDMTDCSLCGAPAQGVAR